MDGNVELLNYIHQNSEMGQDTIEQLVGISKDEEILDLANKLLQLEQNNVEECKKYLQ